MNAVSRFARDGAATLYRAAHDRMAERRELAESEFDAFAAAMARAKVLVEEVASAYEPAISQADVDAVSWKSPVAVEDLLGAECDRIRSLVEPLLHATGFPLGSKNGDLRSQMTEAFKDLLRPLHLKAFGALRLPPFFAMRNGLIEFEPTFQSDFKVGAYPPYVGAVSGYRYYESRYKAERPSLGFY